MNPARYLTISLLVALTQFAAAASATELGEQHHGRQASLTENGVVTPHFYTDTLQQRQPKNAATSPLRTPLHHHPGVWVYEVTIGLNHDYDSDGHYSHFSVTLDFDTTLRAPLVYAVLYVSIDNGPWNEYAISGNFTIDGASSSDAYTIHTSLDSGYPTGYYDHYVELYDAYTHEFLTSYGPGDSHYFYHLPFESSIHDGAYGFSSAVSLRFSGTGSAGLSTIGLLLVLCLRRIRARRPQQHL